MAYFLNLSRNSVTSCTLGNVISSFLFIHYLEEKAIHSTISAGVTGQLITYSTWMDEKKKEKFRIKKEIHGTIKHSKAFWHNGPIRLHGDEEMSTERL